MATVIKQPSEIRDLSFALAALLSAGASVVSATGYACRNVTPKMTTTLAVVVNIDDGTITTGANPGIGARLIVNPGSTTEETFKVVSVAGAGPYVLTVTPTAEFAHTSGESCQYNPGASSRLLTSTTATITGGNQAVFRLRRGASGQTYTVSVIAVANNGEEIEDEVTVQVTDLT